ncbi:MAG: transglutaminase domain-containing protein [Verrucomicrobiota bacterium]|nr:transglutaminase domain-containing protein [Verrucomicrobiota bacterium]
MKTPPMLIGAALLFWGWRVGQPFLGVIAAVLLEASYLVRWRWNFSDTEYYRLWDLCTLLFGGVAIYLRFSEEVTKGGYLLFQWMPLLLLPIMLGQLYGSQEKLALATFSWFARKRQADKRGGRRFNISYLYFLVVLISAGASNGRDPWFYLGVCILCGAAGWNLRGIRFPAPAWAGAFMAACLVGFYGHVRINQMQNLLEARIGDFFTKFAKKDFDPNETRTTLGHIGKQKQSNRILMRVQAEKGAVPPRLRQASYNIYREGIWLSRQREFAEVTLETDGSTWKLDPAVPAKGTVRVSTWQERKRGILSVPLGSGEIRELPVTALETNGFGAFRTREAPGVVSYLADFDANAGNDLPPDPATDFSVPEEEKGLFQTVANNLDFKGLGETQILEKVERYFANGFKYSLEQSDLPEEGRSPLNQFLLRSRAGHCEYFASATVLLLRTAGIPARYATGYAVQERKDAGELYLVRERHAHAWALAFIEGRWREVDTTPGDWNEMESANQSAFQPIKDWWENVWFGFSKWRWLGKKGIISQIAPWLVLPLALLLLWRIFGRRQRTKMSDQKSLLLPGLDSEFYRIEKHLAGKGFLRQQDETLSQWLRKVQNQVGNEDQELGRILELHYRHRFDPAGLPHGEREELSRSVERWLSARNETVRRKS